MVQMPKYFMPIDFQIGKEHHMEIFEKFNSACEEQEHLKLQKYIAESTKLQDLKKKYFAVLKRTLGQVSEQLQII